MIKKIYKENDIKMGHKYNNLNKNAQHKLLLTNEAKKRIKAIMLNDSIVGLRIDVRKSGCAGFSYMFKKVPKLNLNKTDIIFEYDNGAKLFVSCEVLPLINGSELDYIQDGLSCTFKFNNPNARHICGCGESFNM